MTKTKKLLKLNIQLFSDGGAAGDGSATGEGVTATDAMSHEGENVQVAAEQESTAQTEELTPEQLEAEYEEAIKGKYKSIHQKKMSNTIRARLNDVKPMADKYKSTQPLLQKLAERYGVENAEDVDAIMAALEENDPREIQKLEEEALELEMPVEQLKKMKKLEKEHEKWKQQEEMRKRNEAVSRQVNAWNEEAQRVREIYPNFNFEEEIKNSKDFSSLLQSGIPMQKAYEVVHFQELMTSGMQTAQKEAEKKLAKAVASNTKRVAENGISGNSAVVHTDVSRMTREERERINARVLRGERVVL